MILKSKFAKNLLIFTGYGYSCSFVTALQLLTVEGFDYWATIRQICREVGRRTSLRQNKLANLLKYETKTKHDFM